MRRVYVQPSAKTIYCSFEGNFICNSGDSKTQAPRVYNTTTNREDFTQKKSGGYDSRLWAADK